MSETYITYGLIAELKEAVNFDDFEQSSYDDYKNVGVTYNGKFFYTTSFHKESYDFDLKIFGINDILKEEGIFKSYLEKYNFEIVGEIKPYMQQYYSGSDATINMIEEI